MNVVQTPSPWAMVASRWTCVPSSWEKISVSASHSCGNFSATWATGQWCWQSCSPRCGRGALFAVAAYPSAQGLGQRFGPFFGGRGLDGRAVGTGLGGDPGAGEGGDGFLASLSLGDPAQRVRGELVVRLVEGVAAAVRQGEDLGGATARAGAVDPLLACFHDVVGDQCVEVPADGGVGEAEAPGEIGDGRGAVVQDGARDPVAGAPLPGREFLLRGPRGGLPSLADVFHNAIVA